MKIKIYTLFLSLMYLAFNAQGQMLSPHVLATQGTYMEAGGSALSLTIGETFTPTLTAAGQMLTQGFQQSYASCAIDTAYINCYRTVPINENAIMHYWGMSLNYSGSNGSVLQVSSKTSYIMNVVDNGINNGPNQVLIVGANFSTEYYDTLTISVIDNLTGDTCNAKLNVSLFYLAGVANFSSCTQSYVDTNLQVYCLGADLCANGAHGYMAIFNFVNNSEDTVQGAVIQCLDCFNDIDYTNGNIFPPGITRDTFYVIPGDTIMDSLCVTFGVFDMNYCGICSRQLCFNLPACISGCNPVAGYFNFPDSVCASDSFALSFGGGTYYKIVSDYPLVAPFLNIPVVDSPNNTGILVNLLPIGTYPVKLIVGTDSNFTCSDTISKVFNSINCCDGIFIMNDTVFCTSDSACFFISGGSNFALYDFGSGASPVPPQEFAAGTLPFTSCFSLDSAVTGYHKIVAVIYGQDGACTDTLSKIVYIKPYCACSGSVDTCPAMAAKFTYTLYSGYAVLKDISTGDPNFVEWYIGGQTYVTGPGDTLKYVFAHSGMFSVCQTIHHFIYGTDLCCIADTCVNILGSVDTCSLLGITANFSFNPNIAVPRSYNFYPMWTGVSGAPNVITWSFGDGVTLYSDSTTPVTHSFGDSLSGYDVCVTEYWYLSGNYCCIDSQCYEIGFESELRFAPNPASDHVTFTFYLVYPGNVSLTLFDEVGKAVATPIIAQDYQSGLNSKVVELQNLAAGVYTYRFTSADGMFTGKIIKE